MLGLPKYDFVKRQYCLKLGQQPNRVDKAQPTTTKDTRKVDEGEFLHCAGCRFAITRLSDRIKVNDQHQHVFANPHGYIYQIGCFAQANGCVKASRASSYFSWFPGYSWQVALCGQCLTLLGWAFQSQESAFFGLILEKLVEMPRG